MFIKAQSYGRTLHSESKQSSTHTSTKIVWPQRQAKITYTHCDRPQPGLKRRDQLVIQVPASMYVCVPKQFVGDLSANLSQTHYTYAPSEPYCTYAPCDPQRNNGRNEVKWPAEQPVDSALFSLSLILCHKATTHSTAALFCSALSPAIGCSHSFHWSLALTPSAFRLATILQLRLSSVAACQSPGSVTVTVTVADTQKVCVAFEIQFTSHFSSGNKRKWRSRA